MGEAGNDYSDLKAIFFNGTLKKSPEESSTDRLIAKSIAIMQKQGVNTEVIRVIDDENLATGVYPDMREHGWEQDSWPAIFDKVKQADIVVLAGPIWLGDNSSQTRKVVERLYANSAERNDAGQYVYYGKVGGCLITGNEDGAKHCAMSLQYSLQHIGFTIPPQSDAAWLGEIGPGPSYGDVLDDGTRAGYDSDFTNRNTTFMTWNLLHMARLTKDAGGIPTYGNLAEGWKKGERYGFDKNPEYRK